MCNPGSRSKLEPRYREPKRQHNWNPSRAKAEPRKNPSRTQLEPTSTYLPCYASASRAPTDNVLFSFMGKLSHSVVNTPPKSKQKEWRASCFVFREIRVGCNTRRASCSFTGKWSHAVVNRTAEIAKKLASVLCCLRLINRSWHVAAHQGARSRKPQDTKKSAETELALSASASFVWN